MYFWDEQLVLSWVMQQDTHGKNRAEKFECFMIVSWVFHYIAVGGLSWIYSIYPPTGVTAAQYDEFLNIIENNIITNHEDLSEAFYLVGDWNAHIGPRQ